MDAPCEKTVLVPAVQHSCEDFIAMLASKAPTPGGGGAAALVGAIGLALGNMVGSLTVGKQKYAAVEDEIIALNERAAALERRFLDLVAQDAEVFEPLSRAYGLPKDTPEQQAHKAEVMESCLDACCTVPMDIMRACCEAIDMCADYAAKGSVLARSDAGCSAACLKSALQAASLNVFINTKAMADRARAEHLNAETDAMLQEYCAKADAVFAQVAEQLR